MKNFFFKSLCKQCFYCKNLKYIGSWLCFEKCSKEGWFNSKTEIWDTAGQDRFRTITKSYFKGAHAIVLIFSVIDSNSFANVRNWITQIRDSADKDVILILVGNKIDCEDREVDKSEGEELANELNIKYYDCSAKTGENINKAFDELVETMIKTVDKSKVKSTKLMHKVLKNKKEKSCC